jgi:hypothetical protein
LHDVPLLLESIKKADVAHHQSEVLRRLTWLLVSQANCRDTIYKVIRMFYAESTSDVLFALGFVSKRE